MKSFKFIIFCMALMLVSVLSSCINDNDGSTKPTYYTCVTLADNGTTLYTDDGLKLIPSYASLSKLTGFSSLERAYIAYTLQDGQATGQNVTSYAVDVTAFSQIPTANLVSVTDDNVAANDTLKSKNDPVVDFSFIATDKYVTVQSTFYYIKGKIPTINMWRDTRISSSDTLYLNLFYDNRKTDAESFYGQSVSLLNSFRMPHEIYSLFPGKDSIVVALSGMVNDGYGYDNSSKKTKTIKVGLRQN